MFFRNKAGFAALAILLTAVFAARAAETPLPPPETALLRIEFTLNESALSSSAHDEIAAFAADVQRQSSRLLIKAYAGPPRDASSTARKLSLRRALSVRNRLIESGVVSGRIHVRALGGTSDSGPQDRVDIVLAGG